MTDDSITEREAARSIVLSLLVTAVVLLLSLIIGTLVVLAVWTWIHGLPR